MTTDLVREITLVEGDEKITTELPAKGALADLYVDAESLSYTKAGWKLRLHYFNQACTIRQKTRGNVEIAAPFVRTKSGRERLDSGNFAAAVIEAGERLAEVHARRHDDGDIPTRAADEYPTWRQFRIDCERAGILTTERLLALDMFAALEGLDTAVDLAGSRGKVDHFYTVRMGMTFEVDEDGAGRHVSYFNAGKTPDYVFPEWFTKAHRMACRSSKGKVMEVTAHHNISHLHTLFNKAQEHSVDGSRQKIVPGNPLGALKTTKGGGKSPSKGSRHKAEAERYSITRRWATWAEEVVRRRARTCRGSVIVSYKGGIEGGKGGRPGKAKTKKTPHIVPGMIEAMLYRAYRHGNRNTTWQHDRADYLALDQREVRGLFGRARKELDHEGRLLGTSGMTDGLEPFAAEAWEGAILCMVTKIEDARVAPIPAEDIPFWRRYAKARQNMLDEVDVDSPWLFPDPKDPTRPISDEKATGLIRLAEKRARWDLMQRGLDPDYYMKIVKGSRAYTYRHGAKMQRNILGYENTNSSFYIGGWRMQGGTGETVYGLALAKEMEGIVAGENRLEALAQGMGFEIEVKGDVGMVTKAARALRGELLPWEDGEQ